MRWFEYLSSLAVQRVPLVMVTLAAVRCSTRGAFAGRAAVRERVPCHEAQQQERSAAVVCNGNRERQAVDHVRDAQRHLQGEQHQQAHVRIPAHAGPAIRRMPATDSG